MEIVLVIVIILIGVNAVIHLAKSKAGIEFILVWAVLLAFVLFMRLVD